MIEIDDGGSFSRFAQRVRRVASRVAPALADASADELKIVAVEVQRRAASILPKRGGLAGQVSEMTFRINRKGLTTTLEIRSPFNLDRLDHGSVVHPVYGHGPLVHQPVPSGFWSNVVEGASPRIRKSLDQALERVIRDIE